jgi:hypothetical protein
VLVFAIFLQGVGVDYKGVLKPIILEVPTKCSTKAPNEIPACLGQASSSRSFRTQAMVTKPPIASQKLILETMFTIKEDFSKNEATKWAIRELKHHGLKWLFKLVASTAYECLVRSFYKNLKYDCNRPDVLVSSIDNRGVEVTITDIAATLKCHDEPPKANEPWIVCPSMLTIEDIVSNMCKGQYASRHQNAASKAKIPPKIWFVDVIL